MARKRYQRGSLFTRGTRNKVWVGRWLEDEVGEDGKLRRVHRSAVLGPVSSLTRRLAQRELDRLTSAVNQPDYRPTQSLTFAEFASQWEKLVLLQHKPSTQTATRSVIKKWLLPRFGDVPMKLLTTMELQRAVGEWSSKASPKTVRNIIMVLRSMWKTAKAWSVVSHNPFEGLMLPQQTKPETRFFTIEETRRIIAETPDPRTRLFFWLAAETGMRAGELAGLRVKDVDTQQGVVQVRQSVWGGKVQTPKTSTAMRAFAISPWLAEALSRDLAGRDPEALVFSTATGRPLDPGLVVKRKLYPLLDRLGIRRAGMHAFRHANATFMDALDAPMKLRQTRLGHANAELTLGRYTHAVGEDDRRLATGLGEILCPNLPKNENGLEGSSLQAVAVQ